MCSPTRQQSGDATLARLLCLGEVRLELGEMFSPKPFILETFSLLKSVTAENVDGVCGLQT